MNSLARWDPFRESQSLRSFIDRYFDEPFFATPQLWSQRSGSNSLPLDVIEEDGEYIVKASVPGVNPEDVEITLTDNVLTIKGEMKQEDERDESNYHVRERRSGGFMRQIALPTTVDPEKVEATNENGVLTLHLPKSEAAKPKKIAVKKTVESTRVQKSNGNAS
jgi:HSP20 family protein